MPKVTSKLCMQKDLGVNNNLFGGFLLQWCDECAAIYAHQVTGERRMVTKKFSEFEFHSPVKVGDILEFYCETKRKGVTSIEIELKVVKEKAIGTCCIVTTTCVFVCVDENGYKKAIAWK